MDLTSFYQKKRDLFLSKIKNSRFKVVPSSGTYFQLLDYSEISDMADIDFSKMLTIKHKVASIPPSVFYKNKDDNKILRFCFAKKDTTLQEAALKLSAI